ncbi:MAG: histidine kinase [Terracidiphilus sp.]|jgi:two-component sensor histidine kinase
MSTNAVPFKHKWLFVLLWTNVAVALIELIAFVGGPARTTRELLQSLAFTFVYANLTSVLAVLILGWLIERAAVRGVSPWKVGIPGILVFTAGGCLVAQSLLAAAGFLASHHFWLDYYHTLRFSVPLALVFGLGAMTHATLLSRVQVMKQALHEKEIAEERSRKLAAEARLRSLESWIHPHFLFNTLNSISALIAIDPARAEQIVGRLATLLRASLDTSANSLIPLHQEIAMVESYLDIERVRLGEKLRARVEVPVDLQETMVPTMSVQSLVENAVKHGITPQSDGGEVLVTARADAECVRIDVADTGPGFELAGLCAGHGLDKLVQRLDALFGDRARLNVFRRDAYSVVEIVLPRL